MIELPIQLGLPRWCKDTKNHEGHLMDKIELSVTSCFCTTEADDPNITPGEELLYLVLLCALVSRYTDCKANAYIDAINLGITDIHEDLEPGIHRYHYAYGNWARVY